MQNPNPAPFRVVMSNEGGELDSREARDEAHAREVLREMIDECVDLYAGDTFRIEGPKDDDSDGEPLAVGVNSPALAAHPVAKANAASWPSGPKRRRPKAAAAPALDAKAACIETLIAQGFYELAGGEVSHRDANGYRWADWDDIVKEKFGRPLRVAAVGFIRL